MEEQEGEGGPHLGDALQASLGEGWVKAGHADADDTPGRQASPPIEFGGVDAHDKADMTVGPVGLGAWQPGQAYPFTITAPCRVP